MKTLILLIACAGLCACNNPTNLQIYASKPRKPNLKLEYHEQLARHYLVPLSIVKIVRHKESSGGANAKPRLERKCLAKAKFKRYTPKQRQALCTSWGDMQVMGFHALDYGLNIDQLVSDEQLQTELGVVLLSKLWNKYSDLPLKQRIYQTCKRYNGSGQLADRYAKHCLELWLNGLNV